MNCLVCGCPKAKNGLLFGSYFCPNEHKGKGGKVTQPKSSDDFLINQTPQYKKRFRDWLLTKDNIPVTPME